MNDLNQLEKELQFWIPRAPSARLKERLFPREVPVAANRSGVASLSAVPWARFAPAMCVVLLALIFGSMSPGEKAGYLAVSGDSNVLAGLAANMQGFCATNTRSERQNNWAMPASLTTFDWTKAGHSLSTTDSFPSWKTNIEKL